MVLLDLGSLLLQQLVKQQQDPILLHPFSLSLFIIIFSSGIFFLLRQLHRVVWSQEKLNPPPSPPRIPIIGNIHQLGPRIHQVFQDLSLKYGPLMTLYFGQNPFLVVSSPEMAAEIMKTHDLVFSDRFGTIASKVLFYAGHDIALAPYGEYWRQVRKICVLELLGIKRVQSFQFVREKQVNELIDKISSSSSARETINLSEILFSLSYKIISRCSLGENYKQEYTDRFAELLREADGLIQGFSFEDFFPWLGLMDILTRLSGKLKRTSQELDTFFDRVIDEHLLSKSHVTDDDQDKDDKKNFIDLLLLHADKDNLTLSRDNIKGIIMDMFVGGSDTSATIIEWTMAELIKNPKLMRKAQDEVRNVVGKKSKVEEQDINQMDYLKSVIKESLRLHPPLPLIARKSSVSVKIGGYDIPANTEIFINAWAIQRDSKSWDNPN